MRLIDLKEWSFLLVIHNTGLKPGASKGKLGLNVIYLIERFEKLQQIFFLSKNMKFPKSLSSPTPFINVRPSGKWFWLRRAITCWFVLGPKKLRLSKTCLKSHRKSFGLDKLKSFVKVVYRTNKYFVIAISSVQYKHVSVAIFSTELQTTNAKTRIPKKSILNASSTF